MNPLHSAAAITSQSIEDALGYSPADDAFALHKTGNETKTGDLAIVGTLTSDEIVAGAGGVVIVAGSVLTLTGTGATSVIQTTPYGDAIRFPASVFGWDGNQAQFFTAPLLRGNLEFVTGNTGCYGFGSSSDPLGVADAKLKRAGVGGVGAYQADGTTIGYFTGQFRVNPTSGSADPTTSNFASGFGGWWKNTTNGEIRFWVNDGGTMKKSAALT